jgi:hypothetical protein
MDNLFKIRVLTTAVNKMKAPAMVVYNRLFRPRENMQYTDRLAFDVISGSERVLKNIAVTAAATVTNKTGRKTITLQAPRLATKRHLAAAELNGQRGYGEQVQVMMMEQRIAIEQQDMKNEHDRTLEFWACNALKGIIYDSDMTTELVNYGVATTHKPELSGTGLWTNASSQPINQIREWKRLIRQDSKANITGWLMFLGYSAMDAILQNTAVLNLLKYEKGRRIAEEEDVARLAQTEMIEYDSDFLDEKDNRHYFVDPEYAMLIGLCDDLVDCPYAPVVDLEAPQGVGNIDTSGSPVMYFSKSWMEKDPSGRWIKLEGRPLPVLQRPGAVVYGKVV